MEFPLLERLSPAECRRLLPDAAIGRLAVPTPTFPTLEPVAFAVVEGELVVAVRAGSAGDAVAPGTVVAFEADALDPDRREGWSIVVKGAVEELDADVVPLVAPALGPWPMGPSDRLLLIRSEQISGQRVVSDPSTSPVDRPVAVAGPIDIPVDVARRTLSADEALLLLRRGGEQVGRLVLTVAGEAQIFPLNYALDGDAVVFRTQVGTKLSGITRSLATFEVDHFDSSGQGWAVSFEGLAQELLDADPAELRARIDGLSLDTWPGGDRQHVVRITSYAVRGTTWTAIEVPAPAEAAALPAS
jgi:nitroimidazol reductase NimA-like FMN-containing flavoprotein (pyridoxamine 5'-phosphate oxidase superfamily)